MGERSFRPGNGDHGLAARVSGVEHRTKSLEDGYEAMGGLLIDMSDAVGGPADDGLPARGLYLLIDSLNTRLSLFERLRERAIGAVTVGVPLLGTLAAFVFWVGGEKIARLFH